MEKNVRLIDQNLNRSFIRKEKLLNYEDERAEELMNLLDTCDALLDLHAYHEPEGESIPFAICNEDCFEIVKNINVKIVVSKIGDFIKGGTDSYIRLLGKTGMCIEIGALEYPEKFVDLGIEVSYQFLQQFGCVEKKYEYSNIEQTHMEVVRTHKKEAENILFSKQYKTFDEVHAGEVIAVDNGKEIIAENDGYIMFPKPSHPIGVEALVLAKKINI